MWSLSIRPIIQICGLTFLGLHKDLLSTDARCLIIMLCGPCNMVDFYAKHAICRRHVSVRVSVCVSVTLRYCIKTAKRRIMQIMPHDRSATLVYTDKRVMRSLCHSRATLNFWCSIHILGMAEARALKLCRKGDYIT